MATIVSNIISGNSSSSSSSSSSSKTSSASTPVRDTLVGTGYTLISWNAGSSQGNSYVTAISATGEKLTLKEGVDYYIGTDGKAYYTSTGGKNTKDVVNNQAVSTSNGPAGSGILSFGSQGDSVKAVQARLNELGYRDADGNKLAVDGHFGAKTLAAVNSFKDTVLPGGNTGDNRGRVGETTMSYLFAADAPKNAINVANNSSYKNYSLLSSSYALYLSNPYVPSVAATTSSTPSDHTLMGALGTGISALGEGIATGLPQAFSSAAKPNNIGLGTWNQTVAKYSSNAATAGNIIKNAGTVVSVAAIGVETYTDVQREIDNNASSTRIAATIVTNIEIGGAGILTGAAVGGLPGAVVGFVVTSVLGAEYKEAIVDARVNMAENGPSQRVIDIRTHATSGSREPNAHRHLP